MVNVFGWSVLLGIPWIWRLCWLRSSSGLGFRLRIAKGKNKPAESWILWIRNVLYPKSRISSWIVATYVNEACNMLCHSCYHYGRVIKYCTVIFHICQKWTGNSPHFYKRRLNRNRVVRSVGCWCTYGQI